MQEELKESREKRPPEKVKEGILETLKKKIRGVLKSRSKKAGK